MFKKLSANLFALALVAAAFAPAAAQDTVAVYGQVGTDPPSRVILDTPSGTATFSIYVTMKATSSSSAAEFTMDELKVQFPGLLITATAKVNDTNLDLGDNANGEFIMAFKTCIGPGPVDLVRRDYLDLAAEIGNDVVIGLSGTTPTTFGGEPGYVNCSQGGIVLTREAWTEPNIDPTKKVGVVTADGVCVLNPLAIPNEVTSMGAVKARF